LFANSVDGYYNLLSRWIVDRHERLLETEVIEAWSRIVGEFIATHFAPVALRECILYVRVLQPALHYELEQVSKIDILRKLKQRFGGKIIRDVRFRVG
jgi:predicted nucleic acid-binding Zn ribbon protein